MKPYSVAIVDDHTLIRQGLCMMLKQANEYEVIFEAGNGAEFIEKVKKENRIPDVVLLDVNMPVMSGVETAEWISENLPDTKIITLSMLDDEATVIKMIRAGAKGYLLKNGDAGELKQALSEVITKGFYCNEMVDGRLTFLINNDREAKPVKLSDRELEFLKLSCSELAYKEIAAIMNVSTRTVEGYRDSLFEKLALKTRVGLVMYAIKNQLVVL